MSCRDSRSTAQTFYEKLGFKRTGGDGTGYVMKTNGDAVIGLFQGMFKGNILTFNPGLRHIGPDDRPLVRLSER